MPRTDKRITAEQIAKIAHDQVVRVYSGRPGCGCGCLGNYSETKSMITRTLKIMAERADEVRIDIQDKPWEDDGTIAILALEDDTRYRWAYLRIIPETLPAKTAEEIARENADPIEVFLGLV